MSNKKQILKLYAVTFIGLTQIAYLDGQVPSIANNKPALKKPLISHLFNQQSLAKSKTSPPASSATTAQKTAVTIGNQVTGQQAPNVSLFKQSEHVTPQKAVPLAPQAISDSSQEDIPSIYLNFEDASLASIVNYLGEEKKINILPHKDLEATKVTLTTRNPMTLDRAWNVLLTLLDINGFSIIQVGKIYRVVRSQENGQVPLPIYSSATGTEPEDLPDSDIIIRYVYFFNNMKAESAKNILSSMISEQNIIENRDLNICIIKDKALSIKSAMKIIKELDAGGLREAIEMVPLTWANAENVKQLFSDIIGEEHDARTIRFTSIKKSKESTFFSSETKIYPEPIKNALVLMGTQKNIDRIKFFIKKYIDVPIEDAQSRLHIKELKYMKAEELQPILESIIQPPRGTGGSEKAMVIEGGYKVFEDVIFASESAEPASGKGYGNGNRLIIACNREDWRRLDEFINKIDKPAPEAAIEVMIVDASINLIRELGAQMHNLRGKNFAHTVQGDFTHLNPQSKLSKDTSFRLIDLARGGQDEGEGQVGATMLTLGRAAAENENIWAFIKTLINTNNSHIISQPYLVANNHQHCRVSVSQIAQVVGKFDKSFTTNNPVRVREPIPAEVAVDLTPHINLTGTIDLDLDITIDEFREISDAQPTVTRRKLITKAAMAAGEVLILGGLTRNTHSESYRRTPILSSIPIIGNFFKSKSKTNAKQNLYVFIRPTIIKPHFEGAPDEYSQLKLDYAKLQVLRADEYAKDNDPIQRWFFKPTDQTIKERLSDAASGIVRPIDKYIYGKNRPRMVNLQEDPFFKVSAALEQSRILREQRRRDEAKRRAIIKHS